MKELKQQLIRLQFSQFCLFRLVLFFSIYFAFKHFTVLLAKWFKLMPLKKHMIQYHFLVVVQNYKKLMVLNAFQILENKINLFPVMGHKVNLQVSRTFITKYFYWHSKEECIGRLTSSYLPLCVEDNWVSHEA